MPLIKTEAGEAVEPGNLQAEVYRRVNRAFSVAISAAGRNLLLSW